MKPAITASAGLVLLAACATPSHHQHGISTDPHGATSFVTADALSPTPAEPRNGERIARDADGRPYSHALL
ncbi:MAG: hypothetical protein R3265_13935, partial [Hyphomonas sp.]|nr:hypothetical protein [Hyphomonas sp.]